MSDQFEIVSEFDDGFSFDAQGRRLDTWRGLRVKYRRVGTNRWRSFLLDVEDNAMPTRELIEQAVAFHDEQRQQSRTAR